MEPKSYYNPQSLYTLCIVNYVKHLKPRTSQLDEIDGLQTLPPNILADIYLAVSWETLKNNTFVQSDVCLLFFPLIWHAIWVSYCVNSDCINQQIILNVVTTWTDGLIGVFFSTLLFSFQMNSRNDVAWFPFGV